MCRTMIQTKYNEHRFKTSDTSEAMGMFLAKRLVKEWQEDFTDKETGEITTINRCEVLMESATEITPTTASTINFHIQAGDITEFEVTDQCRQGIWHNGGGGVTPWMVTADVKDKNRKFILYARGVEHALEIAKDYIELNFPGHFAFVGVKGFNNCIAITDNFKRGGAEADRDVQTDDVIDSEEPIDGKFYMIELHIKNAKGIEYDNSFLVFTSDAEKAKQLCELWLAHEEQKSLEAGNITPDEVGFETTINTAALVNCYCVIPPDFTRAYLDAEKENE